MRSFVKIDQTNDNIVIRLNEEVEVKKIIDNLKKKIYQLKKISKEINLPILITGKAITDLEKKEIKNLIQDKIEAKILFDMPHELGLHGIKKSFNQEIEASQTKFYRGAVRSGQKIEYSGSVVILGDVNGGAEVVAQDNVIVLGILRGLAHAGASGNKNAIVAAASIECKQIRIANIIKEIEETRDEEGNIIANTRKTYAYVDEDKIVME